MAGSFFRAAMSFPPLRALDTAGGLVLGAAAGMALVWIVGAAALLLPGQRSLRQDVQRSEVLQRLNEIVPPERLLNALARVDPFPSIAGPPIPAAPTGQIARDADVRAAASVVCGSGTRAASGFGRRLGRGARRRHRRARSSRRRDQHVGGRSGSRSALPPRQSDSTRKTDIAVLRVPGLGARPLAGRAGARSPRRDRRLPAERAARHRAGADRQDRARADDDYGKGPVRPDDDTLR